jgi:hypothetical protein
MYEFAIGANADTLLLGAFNANSRDDRKEIAKALLEKIEKMASFLPEPKPSETSWLEQEKKEIDKLAGKDAYLSRITSYYGSTEYHHKWLYDALQNSIKHLKCVINDKVPLKSEMLCWAIASSQLSIHVSTNDAVKVLIENKRLPMDIAMKCGLVPGIEIGTLFQFWGRKINDHIIIPYLAEKITK